MEKILSCRNFTASDAIKEHVKSRKDKIETFYNKLTTLRVVLNLEKPFFNAEVILHGKNIDIEGKGRDKEVLQALDKAFDKVEKQLRKHMDKIQNHHKVIDV